MPIPALALPESDEPTEVAAFLAQAPNVQKIWSSERSHLDGRMFAGHSFANLTELGYLGSQNVASADAFFDAFFDALPGLRTVSFWTSKSFESNDEAALAALASAKCWTLLHSLELTVTYRGVPFEALAGWEDHWSAKRMALQELKLSGLSLEGMEAIWRADFPQLKRLKLSPVLGDALLDQLFDRARLPELESLDVRFNGISGDALQRFAACARERFPRLREIGIDFYTGEKIEDCDWNGAVVQRFDVQLSAEEITERYLKGTGMVAIRFP